MSNSKTETPKAFPGIAEFLFNGPLYAHYDVGGNCAEVKGLLGEWFRVDGWCPYCGNYSTFKRSNSLLLDLAKVLPEKPESLTFSDTRIDIQCARNEYHNILFRLRAHKGSIWKIGQHPSLADIANDESKAYGKVLTNVDRGEFHKAIGLAAHGVGIGSFVYLRRIFERLIQRRFDEFKDTENWNSEAFGKSRMVEKITMMASHLPSFLVEHKQIYSILSLGIHELSEHDCLTYFDILKMSIVEILDEDRRKLEELTRRQQLSSALKSIKPKASQDQGG